MQIVLDTKGLTLDAKHGSFLISNPKLSKRIGPKKVDSIAITEYCTLTSRAVILAIENGIPILFFNRIGKAKARLWSPYFQNLATLRRLQVEFAKNTAATQWIITLLQIKIEGQVTNLKYLKHWKKSQNTLITKQINIMKAVGKKLTAHQDQLLTDCQLNLMGIEGKTAAVYWKGVSKALPARYQFEKRSRRPALDHFNAALNYLYGMTYTIVESALFAVGLDPHLGLLHTDEYKKPTLSFDLIEPFRPWIDKFLLLLCLKEELQPTFFTKNQHGIFLNKHGKAFLIPAYNDFMRQRRIFQGRNMSNKNHVYHLAGLLVRKIRSEGGYNTEQEVLHLPDYDNLKEEEEPNS